MKILLYANSIEKSRLLLPWVRGMSERFETHLTVHTMQHATAEELEATEALLENLPGAAPLAPEQAPVEASDPETALVREVERWDHDLLVLTPAGRGRLQKLVRGSMVCKVVKRVRASVMIVREGTVPPRSIVVCVSGSRHSLTNVRMAARLGVAFGARVTIMMVLSQVPVEFHGEETSMRHEDFLGSDHPLASHLRAARDLLRSLGAEGGVRVVEGMVVQEILEEMRVFDHDLLVLGTHRAEDYDPIYEDLTSELIRSSLRTTLVVGVRADPF